MTDVIGAVVGYLEAAVPGTELHGGELPEKGTETMPRKGVVISSAGGFGGRGALPLDNQRIDVRSYGHTPNEADGLARSIHLALKAMHRRVVANVLLHSAIPAGGFI